MIVGGLVTRKGEYVIISDQNFWMYMTEDTALFQWDPPTPSHEDALDIVFDVVVSQRKGEVEILGIPASGMPPLDVGWSLQVYQSLFNPRGCEIYHQVEFTASPGHPLSKAIVVDRGECTFLHKVRMAKQAGFDLVIVVDSGLTAGQRFIPSLLTEKDTMLPLSELIPLVLVTGRQDAAYIKRAEKVRIAGAKPRERRMVVRGGIITLEGQCADYRIRFECGCTSIAIDTHVMQITCYFHLLLYRHIQCFSAIEIYLNIVFKRITEMTYPPLSNQPYSPD